MLNQLYSEVEKNIKLKDYVIEATIDDRRVIFLSGEVDDWKHVVEIGQIAGKIKDIKGVVNRIKVKTDHPDLTDDGFALRLQQATKKGIIDHADIVIVGAGITGASIARELSKYNVKIIVVDKNPDISEGTTKANNGMVHSGYDSPTGSLKAQMNIKGNEMYTKWAEELDFALVRSGSFVAAFNEEDIHYLETYLKRGIANGVPGIEILDGESARAIAPNLHTDIKKALWTPTAAYVEPYTVVEALAENAIDNGAKFLLAAKVLNIVKVEDRVESVITEKGIIQTNCVINAAGVYADEIAEMVDDCFYTIHPRRGTLIIFDKSKQGINERFIGMPPKNFTKGGGPMQTPEGNPLWGPSAIEVQDKENVEVDQQDIDFIVEKAYHLIKGIDKSNIIAYFSGVRACTYKEDFIIEASEIVKGFIHVSGIQSPGLAGAPAIAQKVEEIYLNMNPKTKKRSDYNPYRKKTKRLRECSLKEKDDLIKQDPKQAHIICRCETVSEAEIVDSINGKIPATTLDAIKRRTRAGMGRCQGGFCGPRLVEILSRELGVEPTEVTQKGEGSEVVLRKSRK